MKSIEELIGQYSLTKTLRFELKPIGKTLEQIERKGVLSADQTRADQYKRVKESIDRYHKAFITESLDSLVLKVKSTGNTSDSLEEYASLLDNSADDEALDKVKKGLRKQVAERFDKQIRLKKLFKNDLITKILPEFLKVNGNEDERKAVESFRNFTTYFSGLNENRKNMYSKEAKSTAIAYRLIDENFPRFHDNMLSFAKIAAVNEVSNHFAEIAEAFKSEMVVASVAEMFGLEYFNNTLTQQKIDLYNYVIGGKTEGDKVKIQGINEYVNLYNQNHPNDKLPLLKPLYKMILSDRVALSWLPEEFNDDEAMVCAIKEFYNAIQPVLWGEVDDDDNSVCHLLKNIGKYDIEHIFISNGAALNDVSRQMFGQYDFLANAIKKDIRQNTKRSSRETDEKYEGKVNTLFKKAKSYSIAHLNALIKENRSETIESFYSNLGACDRDGEQKINLLTQIELAHEAAQDVLDGKYADINRDEKATMLIKDLLDAFKALQYFIKPLLGSGEEASKDNVFCTKLLNAWQALDAVTPLYDKVRNRLTRKPYTTDKIKLYFENKGKFLDGWVDSKTDISDNGTQFGGYILRKKNEIGEYDYFLGISSDTKLLRANPDIQYEYGMYERLDYYQIQSKTFLGSSYKGEYNDDAMRLMSAFVEYGKKSRFDSCVLPTEKEKYLPTYLKRIYTDNNSFYNEAMTDTVVAEAYNNIKSHLLLTLAGIKRVEAAVNLSKHNEYNLIQIFDEIGKITSSSKIFSFFPVDTSLVEKLNERDNKPLFLFKISNKDLSYAETSSKNIRKSRGKENLHTMYFKALMEQSHNVFDIGTAEVFFRKATPGLDKSTTIHKANEALCNKNPHNKKTSSTFGYDIIKDRRYVENKFQLHLSMVINYQGKNPNTDIISPQVLDIIRNNGIKHIIGIDRGERNLLYLSLIDLKGNIIKQISLNEIKPLGNDGCVTNYRDILADREKDRKEARRSWKKLENIKDLKSGYLSQVVHVIAKMMVDYQAIVVLEDLNSAFMQSRQKIERSVYEQFEHKLINKLNYYVDKSVSDDLPGGLLYGLQLASKKTHDVQCGCIFYVSAWNTSKIDPVTGFVNMLDTRFENVSSSRSFFSHFDSIRYNVAKDWFEFTFDYNNFHKKLEGTKTRWTLCTYGTRILTQRNDRNQWESREVDITDEFKKAFVAAGIDIHGNLKDAICALDKRVHLEQLMRLMKLLLQLRNSIINQDTDYILSPVAENGVFYDSRRHADNLPIDADANGAYNIARKGLYLLRKIKADRSAKPKLCISNKEWLRFVQDKSNPGD